MNIRPKTVRRLAILAAGVVLVAGALATVWVVHQKNKQRRLLDSRAFGLAAFKAGDWPLAMDRLGPYKDAHPDDYDALYAYAVARSRVPTASGRHLVQAVQLFEQLNHARPDDLRAAHALLDLYLQFHYNREATELADSILAKDPSDIDALGAKSQALARSAKFDEALAASEKLNQLAPLDISAQLLTFDLLRRIGRSPLQLTERYETLRKAHPDDPRFEMLCALASYNANDQPTTLKWLRSAAAKPAPDAAFVERLARMFDDLKLFGESQALLERAAAGGDQAVLTVLVQRLWQNNHFADVLTRLKDLDAATPSASAELLAFKAMSLQQLGKGDEADAIVKALSARLNDSASQAWAVALKTRYNGKIDPRAAVANYEKALSRDRDNAIIHSWIADAYVRLNELELAKVQWRAAANLMPSWAEPELLISRVDLLQGHEQAALESAQAAFRRAPAQGSAAVALALAWYANLPTDSTVANDVAKLLQLVSEIQSRSPGEPNTLPIFVSLQARGGHKDVALTAIRDALGRETPPETLIRLLAISRANQLGIDEQLSAKIGSVENTSAALAFAHASELARAGNPRDGLDLLTKAASAATTQPVQWQLALAKYRDLIGDTGARDAWIALGDANTNDITIQSTILNSARAAKSDREFIARTIERVRKLTGDEGQLWRAAKARWLLNGPNKSKDSAEAVGILTELVRGSSDVPQYRVLLAAALMNLGNTKDAADHLRAAVSLVPGDVTAIQDLCGLLQGQGSFDESLGYLNQAAKSPDLSPIQRVSLARMLDRQGQTESALNVLKPAIAQTDSGGLLLAAELSRRRGLNEDAAAMYARLLASQNLGVDAIASAADFYATLGKLDEARQALSRLSDPRIPPWQRALIEARYAEAHGAGTDAARQQYTAATDVAPSEPTTWRALAEFEMRQTRWDAALDAVARGLKHFPADPDLAVIKARTMVLKASADENADLSPLIDSLAKDPKTVQQADLLRAVQIARRGQGQPIGATLAQIKQLAGKHPDYYPLQSLLARQYVAARQFDDAAKLADRMLQALPGDPEPAQLATGVYQAAGRWRDMKRSADVWRERSLGNPLAADLAAAEALLNLNDYPAVLQRLAPYQAQVRADPKANPPLIAMLLRAMIGTGRAGEARELLQPLLKEAPAWRLLWLSLASARLGNVDDATGWINTVIPLIPLNSSPEQLALARAWEQVGMRFHNKPAADAAQQILEKLAEKPDADPAGLVMLATLKLDAHDNAAAEALYRRALHARPNIPEAQNNLAYLILQQGGDLNEAKSLAQQATTAVPSVAEFQDTLARVYLKLGSIADAISTFEKALQIDPRNIQSMVGLATAQSLAGKRDKAAELLRRIDAILPDAPPPSDSLKADLKSLRDQLSRAGG